MRVSSIALLGVLVTFAAPVAAQRLIATRPGTLANGALGRVVRGAGDLNNDGVPDFFVTQPRDINVTANGTVFAVSGATHADLFSFTPVPATGCYDVSPIGDVDNDGFPDLTVSLYTTYNQIQVRSGHDGHLIRTLGTAAAPLVGPCVDLGDRNGDGRPDFAALAVIGGAFHLQVISGINGSVLGTPSNWSTTSQPRWLLGMGDLNGDGRTDVIATAPGDPIAVVDPYTGNLLRTVDHPSRNASWPADLAIGDVDGDGRMDVAVLAPSYQAPGNQAQGAIVILSAATGATLRVIPAPLGLPLDQALAAVGDLDHDGAMDFAAHSGGGYGTLLFFSGATGRRMATWSGTASASLAYDLALAGTGDVDGDGDGDLVIGNPSANNASGGWLLMSGRILAAMEFMPTNCAGGPFLPQLGMTRPVLGQTLTLVGRDCPPAAFGTVALSVRPAAPRNLGVNGCDVWFDLSNWVILFQPPQGASWQFNLPLPAAPQLAGLGVALQAFYVPSLGPLGYDLSNGIWAILGH